MREPIEVAIVKATNGEYRMYKDKVAVYNFKEWILSDSNISAVVLNVEEAFYEEFRKNLQDYRLLQEQVELRYYAEMQVRE